jgi:hypothetical protein
MAVQDVDRERDLPVAPISLAPGQRVMVRNLDVGTAECSGGGTVEGCAVGAADAQGQVRVPIEADWAQLQPSSTGVAVSAPGSRLQVTILPVATEPVQIVQKFQIATRFNGVAYNPGDPLTAPARGFGLTRNTADLRRMIAIRQTILEAADPVNYASHWARDLLPARRASENGRVGGSAPALVIGAVGDPEVPTGAAIALARAASAIELAQPDPAYGMTIDQVLAASGAVEGIAATRRFEDLDGGVYAALPGHVRCDPGDTCTGDVLMDVSGYSCAGGACTDGLQAPRLDPPLQSQLVQVTPVTPACPPNKRAGAAGCYSTGASSCDPSSNGKTALLLPYRSRTGVAGIGAPAGGAFDASQFTANAAGRYLECRGRELRFDACQKDLASCSWTPQPPP